MRFVAIKADIGPDLGKLKTKSCYRMKVFNIIWFCVVFFVIIGTCSRDSKGFCDCDCCRPAIWVIWYNALKIFRFQNLEVSRFWDIRVFLMTNERPPRKYCGKILQPWAWNDLRKPGGRRGIGSGPGFHSQSRAALSVLEIQFLVFFMSRVSSDSF